MSPVADETERRGLRRSDLPWYLGLGFTVSSIVVGVGVCAAGWALWRQGPGGADWAVSWQFAAMGAALGAVSGHFRGRALDVLPVAAERTDGHALRTEEQCLWALLATPFGKAALATEAIGLVAGGTAAVVARTWVPAAVLYGALAAFEHVVHLLWLRQRPR